MIGPNNCVHLTVDEVREIHRDALAAFGGLDGVREMALLESAVAAPQASFATEDCWKGLEKFFAARKPKGVQTKKEKLASRSSRRKKASAKR